MIGRVEPREREWPETGREAVARPVRLRLPVGAELDPTGGARFRVWAPACRRLEVLLSDGRTTSLARSDDGYFEGVSPHARAGTLYKYRLHGRDLLPEPPSRIQAQG